MAWEGPQCLRRQLSAAQLMTRETLCHGAPYPTSGDCQEASLLSCSCQLPMAKPLAWEPEFGEKWPEKVHCPLGHC